MSAFVGEGCIYTFTPSRVRPTINLPLHGRDFNSTRFRGAITFCERSVRCPLSVLLRHDFIRRYLETILKRRHFGFKIVKRKETKSKET